MSNCDEQVISLIGRIQHLAFVDVAPTLGQFVDDLEDLVRQYEDWTTLVNDGAAQLAAKISEEEEEGPQPEPESEPHPVPELEPQPELKSESNPVPEPESEPQPELKSETHPGTSSKLVAVVAMAFHCFPLVALGCHGLQWLAIACHWFLFIAILSRQPVILPTIMDMGHTNHLEVSARQKHCWRGWQWLAIKTNQWQAMESHGNQWKARQPISMKFLHRNRNLSRQSPQHEGSKQEVCNSNTYQPVSFRLISVATRNASSISTMQLRAPFKSAGAALLLTYFASVCEPPSTYRSM